MNVTGAGTFDCISTVAIKMTSGVYAEPSGLLYHIARNLQTPSASRARSPHYHPRLSPSVPKPQTPCPNPLPQNSEIVSPRLFPLKSYFPCPPNQPSSLHFRGNTHIRNKSHIAEHRGYNENVGDGYPCGARGPAEVFVAVGCHV